MAETIQVRPVEPDELPQLLDLYRQLLPNDAPLPPEPDLSRLWQTILADPLMTVLVAASGGELLGTCCLVIVPNLPRGGRPYALIENVVTRSDRRGQGIGTLLMKEAQKLAWEAHCYKIMLFTGRKEPEVLNFYRNAGFKDGLKTGFIIYPPEKEDPALPG